MNGVQHKIVGTGFGIAAASITFSVTKDPTAIAILPASMVGCMLPDMDHNATKLGRKRKVVTTLSNGAINLLIYGGIIVAGVLAILLVKGGMDYGFDLPSLLIAMCGLALFGLIRKKIRGSSGYKWATRHRGLMHTNVIPVLLFIGMRVIGAPLYKNVIMGVMIGYVSHLFADMLTVEGCPVLFPLTTHNIRILKLRTKDKSCSIAATIIFVICVAVALIVGGGNLFGIKFN